MIRYKYLALIAFFISGCSSIVEKVGREEPSTYCISIPITEVSSSQIPCINLEIEDRKLLAEIDLGFRGHITLAPNNINTITSKTSLGEKIMHGFRGKQYKKKHYQIPEVKIGSMIFSLPIVEEDSLEFLSDASLQQNSEDSLTNAPGRVGWELFSHSHLLIDMQNSQIVLCDSIETLKAKGYPIESFVKSPLLLERGLVEFDSSLPNKPLRCVLDTGSTWNVINEESSESKEEAWNSNHKIDFSSFQIENSDFGPIAFRQVPIRLPIHIEAILGMEFIKSHFIFLDFENKAIYFSKVQIDRQAGGL